MGATVIVTEAKSELIEITKYLLEMPSYKDIHLYSNPNLAIDEISRIECQLIFVDADIKSLDVKEWIRSLLKKYPSINLVVVSYTDSFALEALKIGAVDFLIKPITQKRLKEFESKLERRWNSKAISL